MNRIFRELDTLDLSGDAGAAIDEQLKLRINTVPRNAQPLHLVVANLMALYFWYVRRPPQQCQNAFLAAKKLRGMADDSQFVEQAMAPLIFGGKIKSFGKRDRDLRTILLHRTAQIAVNFRESDPVNISATRIVRSDSWQKKMLHIAALNQRGQKEEIRSFAPSDELRAISSQNDFAAWYLRANGLYKGENQFLRAVKGFLSTFFSTVFSIFNWRFVIHLFRNRWPVYLVYLALCVLFVYAASKAHLPWEYIHRSKAEDLRNANPVGLENFGKGTEQESKP